MSAPTLPFEPLVEDDGHSSGTCALSNLMSPPLRTASDGSPHLRQYLHMFPVVDYGMPRYVDKLERGMKDLNVIYPVGEETFVHVIPDPADTRNWYLPIEPTLLNSLDDLLYELDYVLLDYVEELALAETDEERGEALLDLLERICIVEPYEVEGERRVGQRIRVDEDEFETLAYMIVRDKVGIGILEPVINDPYVEDISCSGVGSLFIEHKIFKGCKASVRFANTEELDDYVLRLSERIKKPVTFRRPIVDASLPDGSRINIVYGEDVSKRGSNFTIRKFSDVPLSIVELLSFGTLDAMMASYLSMVIADGMNLFCSGETASGKTTLLNALTTFIPSAAKIVTLEDTAELQVPHLNWTRELTREGTQGDGVGMFDLLKAALRQRPNAILVGEIRGEEGAVAFQAMQTGHQVMSTFHAATVEKLIQRITGHPISVPKAYMDNLNVAAIQSAVRLGSGQIVRRVLSINEIVGYDPSSDAFSYVEVFRWNPVTDVFEFPGDKNSYLLESRVAPKKGIPPHRAREIYDDLERRATVLARLVDTGVSDFYELHGFIAKAEREGLL